MRAWGSGDEAALARLTEHVYPELRLMARRYMKNEAQGNTLQATALVHEVYLRLVDVTNVEWQARAQFFAIAAQMMRRILVDAARARGSRRRDGIPLKVNLDESAVLSPGARAVHPGSRRGPDSVLSVGAAPGKGGRTALFRRIDRRGDRGGPENFAAHHQARLGFRQILAAARVKPYNRKTIGTTDMTPERFRQIEELYHAAREGTADERAALLAQADPELRREVESLLAAAGGGEFLDRPAIQNAPELLEDVDCHRLAAGACLGPYRIESKLGEGGMGEVFRAIDTRLGRAVAIKITQRAVQRPFRARGPRDFVAEPPQHLHALRRRAQLPGDGTGGGRDDRGAAEEADRSPSKTALLYASQIAAALVEAHGKGIIHRDLKPGNIMIGEIRRQGSGFRTGELGADETVTASHMVMGTPAYMAPEQREGKPADARSDIYSFGWVLYEMLTGARVGAAAEAHPSAKAGNNRKPVSGRGPGTPVAIRCRVAAGTVAQRLTAEGMAAAAILADRRGVLFSSPGAETHREGHDCPGRFRKQDRRSGV